MAFLERRLIHADALRRLHLATLQPALHGALHDPVHLVPTQPHLKRHRRRGASFSQSITTASNGAVNRERLSLHGAPTS